VIIDPGHGGIDPGAKSKTGILEKDLVLEIAKKLETRLNSYSIYTVLTRTEDTDLAPEVKGPLITRKREDLNRRAKMAQDHGADLLVSIHANSFSQSRWSGAQTFYYPGDDLGKVLAISIQDRLVQDLGPNNRKAKAGDFRILRESKVPSAMVEVGFLSNPKEAELLSDPLYQDRLADAIAMGIVEYFRSQESAKVSAERATVEVPVLPEPGPDEVLLFFASSGNTGLLGCEKRRIAQRSPEAVLAMLQKGPEDPGLTSVLGEFAQLEYVGTVGDTAYVTVAFADDSLSGRTEELAIYSVVNTLAAFLDVENVVVEVINGSGHFDWNRPLAFGSYLLEDHLKVSVPTGT
jgi:N-acetylmuramoyl-L-alanine amidase